MNLNNILFLDIETVSQAETYNHLDSEWKELWGLKAQNINRNYPEETPESSYHRAGIYAEFGKIICISCGYILGKGEERKLVVKSFFGDNEKRLLAEFKEMLEKSWSKNAEKYLCAHNGKEFDYPYMCRRMIANGIKIPEILEISGKKPWDVRHLDTLELWKFGDYKSYTSLKLLAKVLGIPSPKDDIDGSMVNSVYYIEKDLNRIAEYCQKDVITLAQVLLKFHCEPLLQSTQIEIKFPQKQEL
jgi:uncharacterized protein YprB with RNaseH-like and TPR domain